MSFYTILVFVHVVGALGYATGTVISLFGLFALRRARKVEQAHSILELLERIGQFSGISLFFTIVAGLIMTVTNWGWQTGWIDVALGTLVLLFAMGALMGTRRHTLTKLTQDLPDGPLPKSIEPQIYDPWMSMGVFMLATLLLGVIFLMTVQPGLGISLLVIGASIILGLAVSLPNWNRAKQVSERMNSTQRVNRI